MRSSLDLKHALLNPPILCFPQYGKPYTIDVDASKGQLGCALLQEQEDGKFLPVGYWSRTLNQAERNYSATERECLGVVWSILHLRPYLERTRFTVRTDHHALKWALFLSNAEGRLSKWRLRLAEFDFDVVYRPGVKHQVPDALSRIETTGGESGPLEDSIPCPESLPEEDANCDPGQNLLIEDENWDLTACPSGECLSLVDSHLGAEPISKEEWLVEQSYDSLCQTLRNNAERTPSSGFLIREDGLLVRKAILDGRHQIVVPKSLRDRILSLSHNPDVSGHPGSKRMYLTMRQEYY